jgi:hypothetical protein
VSGGVRLSYVACTVAGAVALALAYAQRLFGVQVAALLVLTAAAWSLPTSVNVIAYLALLGVQVWLPPLTLPFRFAVADLFILPVIVRSAASIARGTTSFPDTTLHGPLIGLAAVMIAGIIVGAAGMAGLTTYAWLSKGVGLLFLIATLAALTMQIRTRTALHSAINAFVVGASVVNIVALLGAVVSATVFPNALFDLSSGRLYGTLLNPSSYGSFVATVALIELAHLGRTVEGPRRNAWRHWTNYGLLLLSAGLTLSRSVWLSLVAGHVVILLAQAAAVPRRRALRSITAAVVTIVVFSAPLVFVALRQWTAISAAAGNPSGSAPQLQARVADACVGRWDPEICDTLSPDVIAAARSRRANTGSAADVSGAMLNARGLEDRVGILREAWRDYTATPHSMLLGIGVGTFFATSAADFGVPLIVHNTLAWFLTEMGPIGLIVVLWLLVRTAANLRGAWSGGRDVDVAAGIAAAFLAWFVYSLFNEAFYSRHFWLLVCWADRLLVLARDEHASLRTYPA